MLFKTFYFFYISICTLIAEWFQLVTLVRKPQPELTIFPGILNEWKQNAISLQVFIEITRKQKLQALKHNHLINW